uniref:Uncharacterized protein n=1 Tax=Magnetococcus massalia (strain MO-1) TaxID=451514 RepID=A0A1S7LEQ6_MAGMO|nr:conserved protein of unknown function [Candidatus Magnetococcus massalia]
MSIRRIDKSGVPLPATGSAKAKRSDAVGQEKFAEYMDAVAGTQVDGVDQVASTEAVDRVDGVNDQRKKRQIKQASELLDSLEALEKNLDGATAEATAAERLRETRDEALRNLNEDTSSGEERELLHRTAVMATVELAKSDRGDYK